MGETDVAIQGYAGGLHHDTSALGLNQTLQEEGIASVSQTYLVVGLEPPFFFRIVGIIIPTD